MTTPDPQQPNAQQPFGQQPNPYNQPYVQPPKKRKKWPWIVGGLIVVFIAIAGGCAAMVGGVANEIDKASNSTAEVTYRVTGEGTASVTYSDQNFNIAQDTAAALPWEKAVTLTGFGKIASLTASNSFDADASAKITCSILVNNVVKNTQTSKGPGAMADCTYNVPAEESKK